MAAYLVLMQQVHDVDRYGNEYLPGLRRFLPGLRRFLKKHGAEVLRGGKAEHDRAVRRLTLGALRVEACHPSSARTPVTPRSANWCCCRSAAAAGPPTSLRRRHSCGCYRTRRTHCSCR